MCVDIARRREDWLDLEYTNEVIKTLGGRGHTRLPCLNYIIISLSKITGAISNLVDVLIIGNLVLSHFNYAPFIFSRKQFLSILVQTVYYLMEILMVCQVYEAV